MPFRKYFSVGQNVFFCLHMQRKIQLYFRNFSFCNKFDYANYEKFRCSPFECFPLVIMRKEEDNEFGVFFCKFHIFGDIAYFPNTGIQCYRQEFICKNVNIGDNLRRKTCNFKRILEKRRR